MKRKKANVKRTIKKKIELSGKQVLHKPRQNKQQPIKINKPIKKKNNVNLNKTSIVKDGSKIEPVSIKGQTVALPEPKPKKERAKRGADRDKQRLAVSKTPTIERKIPLKVELVNARDQLRFYGKIKHVKREIGYREYRKKIFVDFDVIICIPSHERYRKVTRLLKQFHEQQTKYSFKIILLNDGSKTPSYNNLSKMFPEITYIKNDEPNGKVKHWYCYNQMWEHLKNVESHAVLQLDDDFILCDKFLDRIMNLYFVEKEKNDCMRGIAPHLWSYTTKEDIQVGWWERDDIVDGICLIDYDVIKEIDYELQPVNEGFVKKEGNPVKVWNQISKAIIDNGGFIFRTKNSLVYHDDINGNSKLHGEHRKNKNRIIYTKKFVQGELKK